MVYTPVSVITITNNHLDESHNLTTPLVNFLRKDAHLVLESDAYYYTVSLARILTVIPKLDLTKPIGTVFTSLLSDAFVSQFQSTGIPVQTTSHFYTNRLSVFNPTSYKDHKVHFTSVNTPHIRDDASKKGFLDDLAIVSDRDMSNYLVAVNGVFHKTVYLDGVLYVVDGFRNIRLKGRQDITIVDTREIGGHTIIPLTSANVTKSDYQHPALVKLTESIVGKTIFPVIDGYFYHQDHGAIDYAAPKRLRIRTNRLPLIQQFRHNPRTVYSRDHYGSDVPVSSRNYVDPYDSVFLDKTYLTTDTLANEDFQYSRLTAFHSFLVVVNNPKLFSLTTDLVPTGTPQFYQDLSNRPLSGMLNYDCGLCPSYVIWKDVHKRSAIFLSEQDTDANWTDQSADPFIITPLGDDAEYKPTVPAKLIDYVTI